MTKSCLIRSRDVVAQSGNRDLLDAHGSDGVGWGSTFFDLFTLESGLIRCITGSCIAEGGINSLAYQELPCSFPHSSNMCSNKLDSEMVSAFKRAHSMIELGIMKWRDLQNRPPPCDRG